eukprot:TRINITY_DN40195_c0_g1_i1.p1 TRINITY_DN40195_c0_g1~~TRINITY_DN40195_c0_g1_i1.p1  ORF type:complete len:254 (-),score=32.27 TRINITY_DN40195_c0_g1_i1:108-812(-)
MAKSQGKAVALAILGQCLFLSWHYARIVFVQPRLMSRPRQAVPLQEAQVGMSATAEAVVEASSPLESTWRYVGGVYDIKKSDGKLSFHENNLQGELREEGEWLVADLPPAGSIRLKINAAGTEITSNFKPAGNEAWGDTIVAIKEWDSLNHKTRALDSELDTLEFEGTAMEGGVVVTLNGRQRPIALKLSEDAAAANNLGALLVEAHSDATEKSLTGMTERLRTMYASHFAAKA